jgi:hypothetical protein
MVRTRPTDRRQVHLVIAPARAGKTTALGVLAHTWTGGGGYILGLAPSATAAAQLAEATGIWRPIEVARRNAAINSAASGPLPDAARARGAN